MRKKLIIREVSSSLASCVADYYKKTREENREFEPARPESFYTEAFWLDKLKAYDDHEFDERGIRFLLFCEGKPEEAIGYVNVDNVVRGVFQSCTLGYALASSYQGFGYMTEALTHIIQIIFQDYNLHRIQANCLVSNTQSLNLLKKLGFDEEGVARDYLLINGKWQDHILTSLINKHWKPQSS